MENTSRILQRLYSLDGSSPNFLPLLQFLIHSDEAERYMTKLKGPELTRLLDLLDKARDIIPKHDSLAQECSAKLRVICIHHGTLPSSYIIPPKLFQEGSERVTHELGYDVRKSTYRDKEVDILLLKYFGEGCVDRMDFVHDVFHLKMPGHPNIIPFVGVSMDSFCILVERMPDSRNLMEYLEEHPEANRIGLLLDVAEGLNYLHTNSQYRQFFDWDDVIVDHEGRARLTTFRCASAIYRVDLKTAMTARASIAPELRIPCSIHRANVFSFGMVVIEVFTGKPPFNQLADPVITSRINDGIRPDRPQGTQKLGLTDSLWEMTTRCWHQDPTKRPNMMEVVTLLRNSLVSCFSMESDLRDFFEACKTQGRDGRVEKAQEFADKLDEALDDRGLYREQRKEYLRDLQKLCSVFELLPFSFLLPQESVKLEATPFDSGGYSSVFKATFNERAVVVKVLNVAARVEREKLHRLLVKEVVGWKWLQHENILPFVGVMLTPSTQISIASEFMENGNIVDFIRKNKDYNRVDLLVDAVTGLKYLHERNIIHGDLKGVNILIDSRCRARLADFGLATIVDESTSRTTAAVGKKPGTIRWMAPELLYPDMFEFTGKFEGRLPSKDTDIYAIGMTILEVITGRVPFAEVRRNETVMLKVVKGERPARPSPGLSETLWNLLVTTWVEQYAQKPRKRPSVSTVLAQLKKSVVDWGKSIIPLIPEDWENADTGDGDDSQSRLRGPPISTQPSEPN